MTITVDFDSNPRTFYGTAGSTVNIRFVDKSTTTNGVINSWIWKFGDLFTWIPDGMLHNSWIDVENNPGNFTVGNRVFLSTAGTLPTGLSSSVMYWVKTATTVGGYKILTLSLTDGGAAVTYSDLGVGTTFYIQHGSDQQNPIAPYLAIAGSYDVSLTCDDSGGTGATTATKTGWIKIATGTFTPPAQTTAYRNVTLFVYERSSEAAPKGACICRSKTSSCNLFFVNLFMQGAMTKAGKATFDIVNTGAGTSDEIDLFESTTIGTYKNIAIIGGYDVIWSGKITRASKEQMSQPGVSPQKAIYHCEAYSDIKKLSDWNIKTPASQIGKSPGQLCALILDPNTGEPDFIGTRGGFIDPSGSVLQMTLTDTDKLTAFSQLTNATDYDWRTRMETMLFQYATFNGSNLTTITSAGFTVNALVGNWILFPTDSILSTDGAACTIWAGGGTKIYVTTMWPNTGDRVKFSTTTTLPPEIVAGTIYYVVYVNNGSDGSTPYFKISATPGGAPITYSPGNPPEGHSYVKFPMNRLGVLAWGRITANDATTITATVTGAAQVPVATDNCLIVQVPRLDFSSDLMEPTVVRAFTNGVNCVRFTNADDKVDLFTKVIVKGKNILATAQNGLNSNITVAIPAKDAWDDTKRFFNESTVVSYLMDGYVYSYAISANSIVLIGQGYALKTGDIFYVYGIKSDGTTQTYGSFPITGVTTQTQTDGTLTTTITTGSIIATNTLMKYSIFIATKTYVKDSSVISTGTNHNIGTEKRTFRSVGMDPTYGPYTEVTSSGDIGVGSTTISPHLPGCIISTTVNSETAPEDGSAIKVHGIITKNITTDTLTTIPDLEVSATNALLQGSQYYQKSSMNLTYFQFTVNRVRDGVQLTGPVMIREGQRISIVPYTGASAIERQVILWEMDTRMIVSLALGDYIRNVFNVVDKNTAATQKALI